MKTLGHGNWTVLFTVFGSMLLVAEAAGAGKQADFWKAGGKHGAVVAGRAEAADAALQILSRGNAVDAAVSAVGLGETMKTLVLAIA